MISFFKPHSLFILASWFLYQHRTCSFCGEVWPFSGRVMSRERNPLEKKEPPVFDHTRLLTTTPKWQTHGNYLITSWAHRLPHHSNLIQRQGDKQCITTTISYRTYQEIFKIQTISYNNSTYLSCPPVDAKLQVATRGGSTILC